jgi:hypothetical protein
MEEMWAQSRPQQPRSMTLNGWVAQADGTNARGHNSGIGYTVLFDFVPSPQPWPLQAPVELPT